MKALIAFIVMAVAILTLIEINERIKKRKKTDIEEPKGEKEPKDCVEQDCSGCALVEHCEERKDERVNG